MNIFSNKGFNSIFNFSKKDRNGIVVLLALLLILIAANIVVQKIQFKSNQDFSEVERTFKMWKQENSNNSDFQKLFVFDPNLVVAEKLDSLKIPSTIKSNIIKYREAGGQFNRKEDLKKIYGMNDSIFSLIEDYIKINRVHEKTANVKKENHQKTLQPNNKFNINSVGYDTLIQVGFSAFQATNILKYREAGGKFNEINDLLKIYGVDSATFLRIKHLAIITNENIVTHDFKKTVSTNIIELNSATENDLKKLKGIGSVFASRIIKFRKLLGGFYKKEQLLEVYNFPEETYRAIENIIEVDSIQTKKIRINFSDYNELVQHPYINPSLANAIITYRSKNGNFTKLEELSEIKEVNLELYNKIKHYLSCH